ncbi:hypothetical protein BJX68DRAFT_157804 [Aspergillus pseudodeflectus]|uniref:F-box domain-containing protein n=1 Tax=Aspergillus pseudodeflectus TaxID=176178 RepID=A0ABR4JSP0_9EURO
MVHFPAEIVQQIVEYIRISEESRFHPYKKCKILPYAVVARQWQVAVERLLWQEVALNTSISLAQLKEWTSGDAYRCARAGYIRHLISMWPNLGCYNWGKKDEQDDHIEQANRYAEWYDEQHHKYLLDLFNLLASWKDQNASMRLSLRLDGDERIEHEPQPEDVTRAEWEDMTLDQLWQKGFAAYPPRLTENSVRELPTLPYITSFGVYDPEDSDHRPSAFFLLLTRFPNVRRIYGGEGGLVLTESLRALVAQRQDLTDHLSLVPESAEKFKYEIDSTRELARNPATNAANYLSPRGLDELSIGFRTLSTRLRKLKLEFVRISSALFWPGPEEEDYDSASLHWPKLEELVVLGVPPYTADGKWILDNDAGKWHHISLEELEADPDQGWDYDTGHYGYREIMRRDAADEMYSSMGRAARRMPRLRRLEFSFRAETGECGPTERLEFERDLSTGKNRLQIATGCWYLIGEKVILAWGLQGKLAPQSVAPECRGRLTQEDERDGSVALVHRKKTKKPSCHDGACSVEFEKWP